MPWCAPRVPPLPSQPSAAAARAIAPPHTAAGHARGAAAAAGPMSFRLGAVKEPAPETAAAAGGGVAAAAAAAAVQIAGG